MGNSVSLGGYPLRGGQATIGASGPLHWVGEGAVWYACMCVSLRAHMQGLKNIRCPILLLSHVISLRQSLSLNAELLFWIKLADQGAPVIPLSPLPSVLELEVCVATPSFLHRYWGLNSGPYVCKTSTLTY